MTDLAEIRQQPKTDESMHLNSAVSYVESASLINVVSVLTLFLALIFGFDNTGFKIVVQLCLLVVLIQPKFLDSLWLWGVIATTGTLALLEDWSLADNHKYLLVYWLWTLTLAQSFLDQESKDRILIGTAKFFLVFIFLAAALQKMCSASYMSGAMFELVLLLDDRFRAFTHLMGVDGALQDRAALMMRTLKNPLIVIDGNQISLGSNDLVRRLALAITWYDLVIQLLIGSLFAIRRRTADLFGHFLLLFFIFTTYIPAPVFGFGWTLAVLGFTVSKKAYPRIALAYLAACLAVLAYQTPWRDWVLGT